jgi:hypothetical protein
VTRFFDNVCCVYPWRIELRTNGTIWETRDSDGSDCVPFRSDLDRAGLDRMLQRGNIVEVGAPPVCDTPQTEAETVW